MFVIETRKQPDGSYHARYSFDYSFFGFGRTEKEAVRRLFEKIFEVRNSEQITSN